MSRAAELRSDLDQLLSRDVRPALKANGFVKSGRTFRRTRGPLYDRINFQGSVGNAVAPKHSFFVNVGIGSTEMDAVYLGWDNDRRQTHEYVLDTRWQDFAPEMPDKVSFDEATDLRVLADVVINGLTTVLGVIDGIDSTQALAHWVVDHQWWGCLEKKSAYLASTGDADTLVRYVSKIRAAMHGTPRWTDVNRALSNAVKPMLSVLTERGLLDVDPAVGGSGC